MDAGDKVFGNEELVTDASTEDFCLMTPVSASAERTRQAAKVKMEQLFTIGAANDGKEIYVYPRAMADLAILSFSFLRKLIEGCISGRLPRVIFNPIIFKKTNAISSFTEGT